jgi:peptidoglycan/LPS O-acetylase OafA/YrhL
MTTSNKNYSTGGIISAVIMLIIATFLCIPSPGDVNLYGFISTALPLFGGGIILMVWSLYKNRAAGRGVAVAIGGVCLTGTIGQISIGSTNVALILFWLLVGVLLINYGFIKQKREQVEVEKE